MTIHAPWQSQHSRLLDPSWEGENKGDFRIYIFYYLHDYTGKIGLEYLELTVNTTSNSVDHFRRMNDEKFYSSFITVRLFSLFLLNPWPHTPGPTSRVEGAVNNYSGFPIVHESKEYFALFTRGPLVLIRKAHCKHSCLMPASFSEE